jgi:hypothetical protein
MKGGEHLVDKKEVLSSVVARIRKLGGDQKADAFTDELLKGLLWLHNSKNTRDVERLEAKVRKDLEELGELAEKDEKEWDKRIGDLILNTPYEFEITPAASSISAVQLKLSPFSEKEALKWLRLVCCTTPEERGVDINKIAEAISTINYAPPPPRNGATSETGGEKGEISAKEAPSFEHQPKATSSAPEIEPIEGAAPTLQTVLDALEPFRGGGRVSKAKLSEMTGIPEDALQGYLDELAGRGILKRPRPHARPKNFLPGSNIFGPFSSFP